PPTSVRVREVLYSRVLWTLMAALALVTVGLIVAFGSRPMTTAVPAAMGVGLFLGRYSRGRSPEEIEDELEETQRQLDNLSLRDPLTGVLNHRGFQDALEIELRRARREGWSVAIVALDIDHFRELNDTRGHGHGDAALSAVAEALSTNLRPGDLCGRVGADEFMLALSGCDAKAAQEVVVRLRSAVQERAVAADVDAIELSAGVSEFPRHAVGRAD